MFLQLLTQIKILLDFSWLFLLKHTAASASPFVMGVCKKGNYDLIVPVVFILHPYAELLPLRMEKLLMSSEKQSC